MLYNLGGGIGFGGTLYHHLCYFPALPLPISASSPPSPLPQEASPLPSGDIYQLALLLSILLALRPSIAPAAKCLT